MIPTGNSQLMKRINRSLLLQAIWSDGPISRAELAKEMRLSPATVSAITDQLLKDGLIIEQGIGESQGGRPPIMLMFRPESRLVIGVSVTVDAVHAALMDLNSTILEQVHQPIDLAGHERLFPQVESAIGALLRTKAHGTTPILGIGMACPGLIDNELGKLVYSSSLGQSNIDFVAPLTERFGLPVVIDNDQNVVALAEQLDGAGQGYQNLIYVSIEAGIGAGIVIGDRLYRGAGGGAGEFGHMSMDVNGPQCRCGNRGCLGVLAGGTAMVAQAVRLVQQRADTVLVEYCEGDIRKLRADHIIDGVRAGDRMAHGIFTEAMTYLGAGVTNVINLFSPEVVILGGALARTAGNLLIDAVRHAVQERALPAHRDRVRIVSASGGKTSGVVGAGLLVIQHFRTSEAFMHD